MSHLLRISGFLLLALAFATHLSGCGSDDDNKSATVGSQVDTAAASASDAAVSDGVGGDVVEVDTAPPNQPPIATDDLESGPLGSDFIIFVLDNDSDPDEDVLKVTKVTQGQLGVVSINNGGYSITWSPLQPVKTGVDSFTYTINDGRGGTDTATVTIKLDPPPAIEITSPEEDSKAGTGAVTISFKVTGCNFTGPSSDNKGCHAHKFLDGKEYKDAQGKGFGQYQYKPFSIGKLAPGPHRFKLVLHKNDGTDAAFEPEASDEVKFEVTETTAP
ncbi:MAG: hypothetical protein CMH53_08840 [Myxococcales bacterium]|nr:hypothetical protein [Myxococcales bacterium]